MTTKVTLTFRDENDNPKVLYLSEPFDEVINKVFPLDQPNSALEARVNMIFTRTSGDRVLVHNGFVGSVEENVAEGE